MQIRTKLTLQFIVVVATMMFFALFFVYQQFRNLAEKEFYDNLRSKALMTAEMVLQDETKLVKTDQASPQKHEGSLPIKDNVLIFNASDELVFTFNRAASSLIPLQVRKSSSNYRTYKLDDKYYLGIGYTSTTGKEYYVVASSIFNSQELNSLKRIVTAVFVLSMFFVALGGYFYTGQALAPVSRIVTEVDSISATQLSSRVQTTNEKDELGKLVNTFNNLLTRLQNAFTLQKSFISNVSHELRNPISIIISQIEVVLSKKTPKETDYKDTLKSVLEDMKELSEISENLLHMARLKSDDFVLIKEPVMLDRLILQVQTKLKRSNPDYHINFEITGTPETESDLAVEGNETLLGLAIINLMDNCCKYSDDNRVDVLLDVTTPITRLTFTDRGFGMSEAELGKIFTPFFRNLDTMHIKGTGIGLSLVQNVLALHHFELSVSSQKHKGTQFIIAMPRLSAGIERSHSSNAPDQLHPFHFQT